jgi:hypothetical protein
MNSRRITALALFATLFAAVSVNAQTRAAKPDAALGERIYREGLLPSGKAVRASVQGDVEVEGTQLNCAGCHRRSGFGSSEGAAFVPAVTGAALYGPRLQNGADNFRRLFQEVQPARFRARVREPRPRPAYTNEALAAALREGVDTSGRTLDPLMPRYRLTDEEARHLAAYLKTLSAAPSPGVTRSEIHFATVVAGDVEPEKRRAMLEVMNAYFRWKNAETSHLRQRGPISGRFLRRLARVGLARLGAEGRARDLARTARRTIPRASSLRSARRRVGRRLASRTRLLRARRSSLPLP